MAPFVTVNGHNRSRIFAEFLGGLSEGLDPSLAVPCPARSEVGAVTPGVPEGRVQAPHLARPSGTSISIL